MVSKFDVEEKVQSYNNPLRKVEEGEDREIVGTNLSLEEDRGRKSTLRNVLGEDTKKVISGETILNKLVRWMVDSCFLLDEKVIND